MQNPGNYYEVLTVMQNLDNVYAKYEKSHEKYTKHLAPEADKETFLEYQGILIGRLEFEEYFQDWIKRIKRTAVPAQTKDSHSMTNNIIKDLSEVASQKTRSIHTSIGSRSRQSNRSLKAKAEVMHREVELKQLIRKQELERQIADMRRQEITILAELKRQKEEIVK
jgi:hypothetical protein